MKKLCFLLFLMSFTSFAQKNVTITKIIEADCSDPFVKSVELYVDGTVDFSTEVVLNYMLNGGLWSDNQIDVSGFGVISNKFVYIIRDLGLMQAEFPGVVFETNSAMAGFNTILTSTSTNGDDGYQVVLNGNVVSQFGKTDTDADDDTIWEHDDSVVSRKSGMEDGTWNENHWDYSGKNSLDGLTACQGGAGIEAFLNGLGGTYPLGSGSGWTLSTETFSKPELTIYPNPINNGIVNISSTLSTVKNVELFDVMGRNVLNTQLNSDVLNVSSVGSGLYILKVSISGRSSTNKIIIR
ncbi:T9SS type A sorting domain-containing protein [Flavivirga sp. 57AJ16]|uniref:T9SS type A sorting domain-containing protein n=1 Tax=Flavivirga sp. 57AJ16 TaxID=3025307 RepID=UPI0023653200|nr:T9SS type A sorting domain-containing protein [Flavivirga sp. 57AJ16]MDD7886289.1 T9SS type A sorting domain-containing protein [Flavivirga sp. 57AJ16]